MSGTVTKVKCKCQHEFQDKMYGPGVRVANKTDKEPSQSTTEVRCTVCKATHTVGKDKLR